MSDQFVLPLLYNGNQKEFIVTLIRQTYTYQLEITIGNQKVFFEPDEEGSFRMIKMPWQNVSDIQQIDKSLILQIQKKLEEVLL